MPHDFALAMCINEIAILLGALARSTHFQEAVLERSQSLLGRMSMRESAPTKMTSKRGSSFAAAAAWSCATALTKTLSPLRSSRREKNARRHTGFSTLPCTCR